MQALNTEGSRLRLGLTTDLVAVVISVISFGVSAVSVYVSNLKSPDISFVTAPYIKHVVDDDSQNEAFYIPLTVINRGARPGTVLSFELSVTHVPSGEKQDFYGQYFTQGDSQSSIGAFFTPMTLNGYSSQSNTVCFYPLGKREGRFFSRMGAYEFRIVAAVANVRDQASKVSQGTFRITVDEAMLEVIDGQYDGEYVYPLRIEAGR